MSEHPPQTHTTSLSRMASAGQRVVLWALLLLGLGVALWPVGQAASGWWSQRALRLSWQRAWDARAHLAHVSHLKGSSRKSHFQSAKKAAGALPTPEPDAEEEWLPTRIVIPSIKLDAVVVRGVSDESLKKGPGHDPGSALPGHSGNCVIAAHRNAYGWWFYNLNELHSGAHIELRTPVGSYIYALTSTRVLPETATWALNPPQDPNAAPRLTLYTCALPHGSHRIVVTAKLVLTQAPSA